MLKSFVQKQLAKKASRFLEKHSPEVIGITGSVGKTTTRNAIVAVLKKHVRVRTTIENYNNEFGLPLTILGRKSPGKANPLGWLSVLLSEPKDVPKCFVLEYGIDHPGDMDVLTKIARPTMGILTAFSPVHLSQFRSYDQLRAEKLKLLKAVPPDGVVIANADDPSVMSITEQFEGRLTYGFSPGADVRAVSTKLEARNDFSFEPGELFSEMHVEVDLLGEPLSLRLKNVLSRTQVSSILCALLVGKEMGVSVSDLKEAVEHEIEYPPGRMNPIAGIKGSLIIDSSYNAAPAAMRAALEVLGQMEIVEEARRIAVLGAMGELGSRSEDEHRMMGMRVAEAGVDVLLAVGEPAQDIIRGAVEAGMDESHTHYFGDSREAGRWLDREIKKGDVVLVKGSQSRRMERVVKDVMAEPLRAKELLVRQYGRWLEEEV